MDVGSAGSGSCLARFPWVLALKKRAPGPWEPSVQPPLVGTKVREALCLPNLLL